MNLLPKKEIDLLKSSEKKIEIDQGIRLARKIDLLRETAAQEEDNLRKFRDETLKVIKAEIDGLLRRKKIVEDEITLLENKKEDIKKELLLLSTLLTK